MRANWPRSRKNAYAILASPRSASQHAANVFSKCLGIKAVVGKTEMGFGHFSMEVGRLAIWRTFLLYQHLFPTPRNVDLVQKICLAPPALIWRNVFDWTVSMAEWVPRFGRTPWGIDADSTLAEHISGFRTSGDERFYQYVIDYELPMYIRFLNGWQVAAKKDLDMIFVNYQTLVQNTAETIKTLDGIGWPMDLAQMPSANDKKIQHWSRWSGQEVASS